MLKGRDIFDTMWVLAVDNHEGQFYGPTDVPYKSHIEEVIGETAEILKIQFPNTISFGSEDYWNVLAIAAGHDLVEDTDITTDKLKEMGFNEKVISGVAAITKQSGESLTAYIDRIRVSSLFARIVKKADSCCNLKWSVRSGEYRRIDKYLTTLRMLHT